MKTTILYPYEALNTGRGCLGLHAKHAAVTGAVYTLREDMNDLVLCQVVPWRLFTVFVENISILVVLVYGWRISSNYKKFSDLQDVYYGVQIAYFAIIGTQLFMIALSIFLFFGIYKENSSLVCPFIVGAIAFTSLEAVATVYSNVLRDHVNREFDALCKAEVAFFLVRALVNSLAIYGVVKFYNMIKAGVTWKGPEAIEL